MPRDDSERTGGTIGHAAAWALADRIMSISYGYAVKMHESILAGKGAQGWQEFKHAAEITSAIGDALDGARDAAEVAYRRGVEAGRKSHMCGECETQSRTGTGAHGDGERCSCYYEGLHGTPTPTAIDADHDWALWCEKWRAAVDTCESLSAKEYQRGLEEGERAWRHEAEDWERCVNEFGHPIAPDHSHHEVRDWLNDAFESGERAGREAEREAIGSRLAEDVGRLRAQGLEHISVGEIVDELEASAAAIRARGAEKP